METEAKKLGMLLIEAGLISSAQLQEALRLQRGCGERLGRVLVTRGMLREERLMEFLAEQTGVVRVDLTPLDIPLSVLQRIPHRLAEQLTILPVAFIEPKRLVLAMADPMDLIAIDNARFASGLHIEPVLAGYDALKRAIHRHYTRLGPGSRLPLTIEVDRSSDMSEALPVLFDLAVTPLDPPQLPSAAASGPDPAAQLSVVHQRSAMDESGTPLDHYGTRALLLGLVQMLQRRGVLGQDELQRWLGEPT